MRFGWNRSPEVPTVGAFATAFLAAALLAVPPHAFAPPCRAVAASHVTTRHADIDTGIAGAEPAERPPLRMPCCAIVAQLSAAVIDSSCVAGPCALAASGPGAAAFATTPASVVAHARRIVLPWRSYYARSRRILR